MQPPQTHSPATPGADASDSTAARLLGTAAALFREKGYSGSTTRELARLLGIKNASLYHHMEKKEDLLYALCVDSLERIYSVVEAAIAPHSEPLLRLHAMITAHMRTALADQDKHATMLIELRELTGERKDEVLGLRDRYERLVRQTLAEAQAAGVLRAEPSAKYQALALLNLLNWTIFWYRPDGDLTPDQIGETLAAMFLEGALAPNTRRQKSR